MGTEFHLRSRDIVVETYVTRADESQSVSKVFTGQREKGREKSVPGWCVEDFQIIVVHAIFGVDGVLVYWTISSCSSTRGFEKSVESR
jgi:hypothetical protein